MYCITHIAERKFQILVLKKVLCSNFSRIHITMETMKLLKQDYEVEEGHGADRHPYLKENNITTYFIVQDDNRDSKVRGKPQIYEKHCLPSLGIYIYISVFS